MKRLFLFVILAFGCSNSPTTDELPSGINGESEAVSFEDVLLQYQALNSRLEYVSYRLQKANSALCPLTRRNVGITVHTLFDYPEDLRPYAQFYLNVNGTTLSLRTVRDGSAAKTAGLLPGDQLIAINGTPLPGGPSSPMFYERLAAESFQKDEVDIKIYRGGEIKLFTLRPETICGYPVSLFFSERINGHTDGREVWITSELMRSLPDDADLALVIAHEMAHAIAGHMPRPPAKDLELEADRIALIMLSRAGYDIDNVIKRWAQAPHPDDKAQSTHPSQAERLAHFQQVRAEIKDKTEKGLPLDFK